MAIVILTAAIIISQISPTLDLNLAGGIDNITHVYLVEHGTNQYQLISTDQNEIKNLIKELELTWNYNSLFSSGSFDEPAYDFIFDDNEKPEDGHNGFITYLPESNQFLTYDNSWRGSIGSSKLVNEFYLRFKKQ